VKTQQYHKFLLLLLLLRMLSIAIAIAIAIPEGQLTATILASD
jgi:hypothetical protein